MQLRGYQREAIDGLYRWFGEHTGNPLLVLPTAAGKSVIQATFVHETIQHYPQTRILLVSHVKELLEQNVRKLIDIWPEAPIGIYSAGLRRRERGYQITVAGIQSVHNKALELGMFDLIMVDECHLIPPTGDGMYRRFMDDSRRINELVKIIGMTATHYRMKTGRLDEGEDALFDGIAYEVSVRRLIDEGFLANLISKKGITKFDLNGVGTRGGEFIPGQLEAAMDKAELTRAAVDELVKLGADRRSWIIFCAGVEHAYHVRDEMRSRGISAATVTGDTPNDERASTLAQFKAGSIQALTNCDVLTTGFDAPNIDLLVMLRPTKSTGLYVQIVGRGMRLAPGKQNCLVLDYAGNIERHGPIDQIQVRKPRGPGDSGVEGAPVKECPDCQSLVPISVMTCPDCGHEWKEKPKHAATASFADILSERFKPNIQKFRVREIEYSRHVKEGKPDSVRVDYRCGFANKYAEWVCFNHEGYARVKATQWWLDRKPPEADAKAPSTCEFLEWKLGHGMPLREPTSIEVNLSPKYPEIVRVHFDEAPEPALAFDDMEDDIPF